MVPPDDETIEDWDDCDGAAEQMEFRLLDSRAASQSKISRTANHTLLEDVEGLVGGWAVADGQRCEVGYNRLIDKCRSGKFRVSSECANTRECFRLLTGKDGQKGAAKDMIDLCRYAVMSDVWDLPAELATVVAAITNPQYKDAQTALAERYEKLANRQLPIDNCHRTPPRPRRVFW